MERSHLINRILQSYKQHNKLNESISTEDQSLQNSKPFFISINSEELQKGQIKRQLDLIEKIEKKKRKGRRTILLTFEGFNKTRYIHNQEIKNYLKRLIKIKPHILYYLHKDSNIQSITLALLEIDIGTYGRLFEQRGRAEFTFYGADIIAHIEKHLRNAAAYSNKLKDSLEDQMNLMEELLDEIDYEQLAQENIL